MRNGVSSFRLHKHPFRCYELSPEKCRSFNFDKESGLCNLLYLDGKTTLRPQIKQGIDLYDMHCLVRK